MAFTKDSKTGIIGTYKTHDGDTGSPEVQVALLSERITYLNRAFQGPCEGPSLSTRSTEARGPATEAARLPEKQEFSQVRGTYSPPRHPKVTRTRESRGPGTYSSPPWFPGPSATDNICTTSIFNGARSRLVRAPFHSKPESSPNRLTGRCSSARAIPSCLSPPAARPAHARGSISSH